MRIKAKFTVNTDVVEYSYFTITINHTCYGSTITSKPAIENMRYILG